MPWDDAELPPLPASRWASSHTGSTATALERRGERVGPPLQRAGCLVSAGHALNCLVDFQSYLLGAREKKKQRRRNILQIGR